MAKIKVLYGQPINAWLGGKLFNKGVAIFDNEEKGKEFAKKYFLKYEIIETEKPKTTTTKRKTSSASKKRTNVSSRSVRKSG